MSKKGKIVIIVVSVIVVLGIGLYVAWPHIFKGADSEVVKSETEEVKEKTKTKKGKEINSMEGIQDGVYESKDTEPATTELFFKTGGATATTGRFKSVEITLESLEQATKKIKVVVNAESVYTANKERDGHLKESDFFDVSKFPEIVFESTSITEGDTSYLALGDISFLGSTKSIEVPFNYNGPKAGSENVHIFEGKFIFDRVAYGMQEDASIGNEVEVTFYTELHKK